MSGGLVRVAAGLWAVAIVAGFMIGAAAPTAWGDAIAHDGPGCPWRIVTGLNCPFCGMTRATIAMARGDFATALDLHPLAPLVLVGHVVLLAIVAAGRVDVLLRGRRPLYLLAVIVAIWFLRLVV
ncbi:MAG: DUF2752 domain-containing protein [Kofleriaceae bacterium]